MSSTTPLPSRTLRARYKESQKHPGRPDVPRSKRLTQEVQAEKAEKVHIQEKREHLHLESIQATARLEAQMEARQKEKLATAHHPPPSTQKRVRCVPVKASSEVVLGMHFFQIRPFVEP
jgi:hypothetical protein